ncbi:MAG: succinylglutamate desuccinylase/aspartoacylase family protein, partial [Brachymonas sp.]
MMVETEVLQPHAFVALSPGPKLIVLGAVPGNEIAGTRGIDRVIAAMRSGELRLARGSVTFLPITNPLAYQKKQRMGERNLNRNLYPKAQPVDYEDRIANILCPLLAAHDVLLDLHSFHTAGKPFAMIGPSDNNEALEPFSHAAKEEALALRLGPQRIVEGWLSTYAEGVKNRLARTQPNERAGMLSTDPRYGVGTTEYMRTQGGWGITLECGQHEDPQGQEVAYSAILNTLAHLQMISTDLPPPRNDSLLLKMVEVT